MWELGNEHCCATCEHAEEERRAGSIDYSCQIQLDALEANLALAVYVDPLARCACYECDENKFFAVHGWRFEDPRQSCVYERQFEVQPEVQPELQPELRAEWQAGAGKFAGMARPVTPASLALPVSPVSPAPPVPAVSAFTPGAVATHSALPRLPLVRQ